MKNIELIAYPEWTENKKKSGLDPLGMQNSSISFYQDLLPGIGNVTLRMRYYGLYAWLAWIYANRVGDTNSKRWQIFLRRAEAIYALISQSEGKESGVAGVIWATKRLAEGSAVIDVANGADPGAVDPYFKQQWGVYGLAYGSQLFQIGILTNVPEHTIPVATASMGEPLARALSQEMGTVLDLYYSVIERGSVSREDLKILAALLPSSIKKESEERKLYEQILFADAHTLTDSVVLSKNPLNINRRKTLLLILGAAKYMKQTPSSYNLRWALYAGKINDGSDIPLSNDLKDFRKSWWIYHSNDLLSFSYAALLKYVLDNLSEHPDGMPLPDLINQCVSQVINDNGNVPATWADFVSEIVIPTNAWDSTDLNSELSLSEAVTRATKGENRCTVAAVWDILKLIGILYKKVSLDNRDLKKDFPLDPDVFRSLLTEKRFLDIHKNEKFEVFLQHLIGDQIIRRHIWVAHKKFRYQGDYTFLIEPDDGKVRLRGKDDTTFTNPRLTPAMNFLRDIHLIDENGLTDMGTSVLESA